MGAPQVLADLGYPQLYFEDRVSSRPPTTEELEALEMPDDMPVIRQFRIVHSENEHPVQVSIQIKGVHLYELLYRETINSACRLSRTDWASLPTRVRSAPRS